MSVVIIGGHDRMAAQYKKMAKCVLMEAEKNNIKVARSHTSSQNALIEILKDSVGEAEVSCSLSQEGRTVSR